MDNVCHTLVGAAMAEAGLKHAHAPTRRAALMIGANLPDVDVLVFATDTPSVVVPPRLDPRRRGAGAAAGRR